MDETEFEEIYLENWNSPWQRFPNIFIFTRDNCIPMVGLNVPKGIARQVARQGFESLSDEQRVELEEVTCTVTREDRD